MQGRVRAERDQPKEPWVQEAPSASSEASGGPEPGDSEARSVPVSTLDLVRRVLLGMVEAIGEGVDLVSASVGEELARSRLAFERRLTVLFLMAVGAALVSAGLMILLSTLTGRWWVTLLLIGGAHLGVAWWLSRRWRQTGGSR